MSYTFIIGISLIAILLYKFFECARRNNLKKLEKIKFVVSGLLIAAFIATGHFLSYPDSLYWFIFSAIIILSVSLSSKVFRNELKRYLSLSQKDKIINACYYVLLLACINIFF
ncbi:hypothetical protein SAMN04515667_0678 [Formosa sp. Hel1_31_208]|nr:hypothetical protein SAMN04515667_0678 [Formosa sp. Hel1_31_208]